MKIKGSKIRFAIDTALAIACIMVTGGLVWQLATLDLELSEQVSHSMGALMGVSWAIVMAGYAHCHRRGLVIED